MQRDLRAVLEDFVATHRGLRLGRAFGVPAAFAGRRMFARLSTSGLELRLPSASLSAAWVTIAPGSRAAARLEILLEQSARYVATS
jgi:hypothetical protein